MKAAQLAKLFTQANIPVKAIVERTAAADAGVDINDSLHIQISGRMLIVVEVIGDVFYVRLEVTQPNLAIAQIRKLLKAN